MSETTKPNRVHHRCVKCGKEHPHSLTTFCECGAMIDVEYDMKTARLREGPSPYQRYFDLLPIEKSENMLSVLQAPTPLRYAKKLGKELGLEKLYVKDETGLPTRSTKDRMAISVLSFFKEIGIRQFTAASTGNSSTSLATYIRHLPGTTLYLFSAEDFVKRLQYEECDQIILFGLRGASFVEACDEAAAFAKRRNVTGEGGFFNPARREGLKTAFLEAAEQLPQPADWYVQAVSSAMGVYGAYKGARELKAMGRIPQLPRLLCVQQESCNPMARAFQAGSPVIRAGDIIAKPYGIAEAILRGNPTRVYPYVRGIVNESRGTILAVSETEIRQARRMAEDLEGLTPCFTASVAFAGLVRMAREGQIPKGDTVLVNMTGGERPNDKPLKNVHWLERTASGWHPADKGDKVAAELYGAPGEAPTTFTRVRDVVVRAAGMNPAEPPTEDTRLLGAGASLDSVTVLEILVGLEREFGIEIAADDVFEKQAFLTVGSLARYIDSKRRPEA
jgi:threonine synthase